ncbi:hypothetical protein CASFOL_016125 [Castilleja foliolosa]|uniref:C3H1-type domain-containing protein n=1 Tax=Castilleja foliolosa TaxID=1961234 RepID=A0ABD3DGJ0_9LAMI
MSERRKRKPAWDEDETNHSFGMSAHYLNEVTESRTSGALKFRDNSERPAWESIEEHPIEPVNRSFKNNARDGKEYGGGKRYYKEMSPEFDDMELRNYNDARDYDQNQSQRYRGRGRSRSRSRSRSLSRGRERERRRGYTRSRSRSRNDVRAKDRTRSRSPISSRLSYGWVDRRGDPEKSSKICRDFSAGSCRRGSQCYCYHPNTISRRDRDLLEEEPTESLRGIADHNRVYYSRASSGFESRISVSDPYHEDRRAATCKNFLRGMCRFGDSCRFSHCAPSDDDFSHGDGNVSFDKSENGKPICKLFEAGNCSRESCMFSHDYSSNERRISESRSHERSKFWGGGPTLDDEDKTSDFNDKRGDITDRGLRDRNKLWDGGPTLGDEAKTLDTNERRGTVIESRSHDKSKLWDGGQTWYNENKTSDINDRRRRGEVTDRHSHDRSKLWDDGPAWGDEAKVLDINDRRGVVSEICSRDKSKLWDGGPTWDNAPRTSDTLMPFCDSGNGQIDDRGDRSWENEREKWGIVEKGNYVEITGFAEPIATNKMVNKQEHLLSSGSQLQDRNGISNVYGQNAFQENPSLPVNVLQQNIYPTFQIQQQYSRVIENNQMSSFESGVLDEVKETNSLPIPFYGKQNVGSIYLGHSSVSDSVQNMLLPNPPSNGFCADLNEPNKGIVNLSNVQTHTQNNQIISQSSGFLEANAPQLLACLLKKKLSGQITNSGNFVNEHSQTHADIPSYPDNSGWAPRVNSSTVQPNPAAASLDLNSTEIELISQIQPKKVSLLSSEVGPPGFNSSKTRQEGIVENSEVGDEIKEIEENKRPETQNGHEKVEEGAASKEEKGTRLFKNNLVEFVKEILKPTWREGRMSRDNHKTVVKKVVEKVSITIHADHIPKTQEKVDQYLACSKPKISKLVQAYVDRSLKKGS